MSAARRPSTPDATEVARNADPQKPLLVLVVDDSAVVRQVMNVVLSQAREITVMTAPDPIVAMMKIHARRPDVIVLDLEMPRMDGLTFLRQIMATDPIPVVICSGHATRGSHEALRALAEGAVEVVAKPKMAVREFLQESATVLIDAVRAAAAVGARFSREVPVPRLPADALVSPAPSPLLRHPAANRIVAITASTGGTTAIEGVLTSLPADAPGLVIVQHMPAGFTAAFAERLNGLCRVEVKEATTGERVTSGRALIARGDRHLVVRRAGAGYDVEVIEGPLVSRHRPSGDVLFRSVAQTAGSNALGIILTGMGSDGTEGLLEMRSAGAVTMAQSEASCVVFGMPKEAIARGAVDHVVDLSQIPSHILRWAALDAPGTKR